MEYPKSTLKQSLREGRLVVGTWINNLHSPALVMMAARCGFDFVSLDMEHGAVDFQTLAEECMVARMAGLTPLVRSWDARSAALNGKLLDAGAGGLIVPGVDSPEMAEEVVKSMRYFHGGTRGFVNMSYGTGFAVNTRENMELADEQTVLVIQIESKKAVERIDAILSTPGVDVVIVGRGDLALDMGVPGELDHPLVAAAVDRVYGTAARHHVTAGLLCPDAAKAEERIRAGARFIHYSNEQAILMKAYREFLQKLRAVELPD